MLKLERGFYTPTPSFSSIKEHIAVMDVSDGHPHGGRLIALIGPSEYGGATKREAQESEQITRDIIDSYTVAEKARALLNLLLDPFRDEDLDADEYKLARELSDILNPVSEIQHQPELFEPSYSYCPDCKKLTAQVNEDGLFCLKDRGGCGYSVIAVHAEYDQPYSGVIKIHADGTHDNSGVIRHTRTTEW